MQVFKGITLGDILEHVDLTSIDSLFSYVYIMLLMHLTLRSLDDSIVQPMFDAVMKSIRAIQKGEDPQPSMDDILDDDVLDVLTSLKGVMKPKSIEVDEADAESPDGMPSFFNADTMKNTKIGAFAQDIAAELNLQDLKIENMEDLFKSNILGNIIGKVTEKLKSADVQKEMVSEMASMASNDKNGIFNNPMFKEVMKAAMNSMGGAGGGTGAGGGSGSDPMFNDILKAAMGNMGGGGSAKPTIDVNKLKAFSARDRLRRKYEDKKDKNKN